MFSLYLSNESLYQMCLESKIRGHFSITTSREAASTTADPCDSTEQRSVAFSPGHILESFVSNKFGNKLYLRLGLTIRSHWPSLYCFLSLAIGCSKSTVSFSNTIIIPILSPLTIRAGGWCRATCSSLLTLSGAIQSSSALPISVSCFAS